ncbi:MAG TPA: pirin-like C-terminal cupin domain-containing protein, partial [Holophagaceae bacterium]|nr:pirin-like C-terminal cupin domain-containing protein [Holophagaceae bacterium]
GGQAVKDQLAVLEGEGDLVLEAPEGAAVLVFAGQPLNEPVAQYGPFVMTTEAELEQAFREFSRGAMGVLD